MVSVLYATYEGQLYATYEGQLRYLRRAATLLTKGRYFRDSTVTMKEVAELSSYWDLCITC